jgi:hypothetical protein
MLNLFSSDFSEQMRHMLRHCSFTLQKEFLYWVICSTYFNEQGTVKVHSLIYIHADEKSVPIFSNNWDNATL